MTFYYFYVLGVLILAAPIVFARRLPAQLEAVQAPPLRAPQRTPALESG
jgi:hypothetical protein